MLLTIIPVDHTELRAPIYQNRATSFPGSFPWLGGGSYNFFFYTNVFCCFIVYMMIIKTQKRRQKKKLTTKLQNSNQNSTLSWVPGSEHTGPGATLLG